MHLLKSTISAKTQSGTVTLTPTDAEDMWHLYNLIRPTDIVRSSTFRKVTTTTNSLASARSITTKRTTLSLRVEKLEYDPKIGELKVNGRVCSENEYVELGQYHTLKLEPHRQFSLEKGSEGSDELWDEVAQERLREATDVKKKAEMWGVVLEEGLAHICIVTASQSLVRQKVETSVRKGKNDVAQGSHAAQMAKFFKTTLDTLLRAMEFEELVKQDEMPMLVLGSAGYTAGNFLKHAQETAWQKGDKKMQEYFKKSALVVHSAGGYLHDLTSALQAPAVKKQLADTKYGREAAVLEKFFDLLRQDEGRACYGPGEVSQAVEGGGVGRGGGVMLISDRLFRSDDVAERRRWVELVERVRKTEGGEVKVLSSGHESGRRLEQVGGIGAILTFPMPDLGDSEEGQEEDE